MTRARELFDAALLHLHPNTFTGATILFVLFVITGALFARLIRTGIDRLVARDHDERLDRLTTTFLRQFAQVILWVLVLTIYAHVIPALDRLGTALLTSVSIASVVIGLAAQSTLGNLIAGISLVFYRPFRLGDRLQITAPTGLETGTVEHVSLGYTRLLTSDGRRVVLSNATISNQIMVNLSSVDARTMAIVPFTIDHTVDVEKAREVATQLAATHPLAERVESCPVTDLDASGTHLALRVWCADAGAAARLRGELLERIRLRFIDEGIALARPLLDVTLARQPMD